MEVLKQKKFLESKEFHLNDEHITVHTKSTNEKWLFNVKYEELGDNISRKFNKHTTLFVINLLGLVGFTALLVLLLIYTNPKTREYPIGILSSLAIILFFGYQSFAALKNLKTEIVYITGGSKTLELFGDYPTKKEVDSFVEKILTIRKEKLKARHAKIDPYQSYEEHRMTFSWLKDTKVISAEEFEALMKKLTRQEGDNKIGFRK